MSDDPKATAVTTRLLYACSCTTRMLAINVRPAYILLALTKNGFSQDEADLALATCKQRWDALNEISKDKIRARVHRGVGLSDRHATRKLFGG